MTPSRLDLPVRAVSPFSGATVTVLVGLVLLMAAATAAALLADPRAPAAVVVLLAAGALLAAVVLAWYLRRAAWLTGTVLSRRGLTGTRHVDLARARVQLQTHQSRQLVLWAHRPDDSVAVGVPLRYDYGRAAGPFIAAELLLALADAIGADEEVATTLRKLATDPTVRRYG